MPTPDDLPERSKGPLTIAEGVRASEARRAADEAARLEARDERQDARTDAAYQIVIDSLRIQLRFAAVIVVFLVAVIAVFAGHELGIDFMGLLKFGNTD